MIGLDTNLLVRLIVEDDRDQALLARVLLDEALERDERCYISDLVLGEVEWVLESRYRVPKEGIILAFQELLDYPGMVFDDRASVERALERFRNSKVELSDLLIGERGKTMGARTTYTFDRALSRQPGFSLLEHPTPV